MNLLEFGLWLLKRGNRESTVRRKLRFLRALDSSKPLDEVALEVLGRSWVDKCKAYALETLRQYAEFTGAKFFKPKFRVYDSREMFVPSPDMVRRLIYRVRNLEFKAQCLIAVETGASLSEVYNLTWRDVNLSSRTVTIVGVKGHRAETYPITEELVGLLSQIPRRECGIWRVSSPNQIKKNMERYRRILYLETGNPDWLKLSFHSLRHFAISWFYFKTKDIVAAQRFARHCKFQNTLRYVHIYAKAITHLYCSGQIQNLASCEISLPHCLQKDILIHLFCFS